MTVSNLHDSYDTPPETPAFSGSAPKKLKRDTMSDALTNAAVAFANVFNSPAANGQSASGMATSTLSPAKSTELKMKNYEQLRYLQNLYDDGILTRTEYTEQTQQIWVFLMDYVASIL